MKVVKRNGTIVEYNRGKIVSAISKANSDVKEIERIDMESINKIIKELEDLNKKRILVEDIQDFIEYKLMEFGKYELAKKYIVYRYTRSLVRRKNTTDESILGLIKKNNNAGELDQKKFVIASIQRNLIAGEVSKDLTKRMLLPEKISKAQEDGILYFHDSEYFLQPIFDSSIINIKDMLDNGTVMNGTLIDRPKSFQVACTVTTQIIAAVASGQYGEQSIDVSHLGKYLAKSKEKIKKEIIDICEKSIDESIINRLIEVRLKEELKAGVQTIQYQISTLMASSGQSPCVTLFLNLDDKDLYVEENAMIIEEILNQRYEGIKDEFGNYVSFNYPKLIYVLYDHNNLSGGKYDYLTNLAIKCTSKRLYPSYISAKKMKEYFNGNIFSPINNSFILPWKDELGNYKFAGRFNQGIVSINLAQIAMIAKGDEAKFWKLLDERLDLCKEALLCRYYALFGTSVDVSPIHWRHGAIARLNKGQAIDDLLKDGYSTLTLGYIGLCETVLAMKATSYISEIGSEFSIRVIKRLKETAKRWRNETGIGFLVLDVNDKDICSSILKIDKSLYEECYSLGDIKYYKNSYDLSEYDSVYSKLLLENKFEGMSSCIKINDSINMNDLIKFIYDNILYVKFAD